MPRADYLPSFSCRIPTLSGQSLGVKAAAKPARSARAAVINAITEHRTNN